MKTRIMRALLWALCAFLVAAPVISQEITGVNNMPSGGAVGGSCTTANALLKRGATDQTIACATVTESSGALAAVTTITGTSNGGTLQLIGNANAGIFNNANDIALRAPSGTTQDVYLQSNTGSVTYLRGTDEGGTAGATIGGSGTPPSGVTLNVVGVTTASTGYRVTNTAASGTLLRGDGTNYVASATTWPNSGTTGDTVIATGSNAFGVVAAAAVGRVPISQGTGTAWIWSTTATLNANSGTIPATAIASTDSLVHLGGTDATSAGALVDTAGGTARFFGRRSGGTFASPNATGAAAVIVAMDAGGYDTTNLYSTAQLGRIAIRASSSWTSTDNSTDIIFQTTPTGSRTIATAAIIGADKSFLSSGKLRTNGTAPTVGNIGANSCGTTAATITGTEVAGKVTVGATAGTACRVTFAVAWATAPACTVTNETTGNLVRATSTTAQVDLTGTMVAGDVLAYLCIGTS